MIAYTATFFYLSIDFMKILPQNCPHTHSTSVLEDTHKQ